MNIHCEQAGIITPNALVASADTCFWDYSVALSPAKQPACLETPAQYSLAHGFIESYFSREIHWRRAEFGLLDGKCVSVGLSKLASVVGR